jgi:protein subunit release factor A
MSKGLPLTITVAPRKKRGGQQTGITDHGVIVELDSVIKIECRVHRSQTKNLKLAKALIELAVDDR